VALSAILSTAVSGLNANAKRAETSANNIANINTAGFKAAHVQTTSIVSDPNLAGGSGVQAQTFIGDSPTNLVRDITRLIEAEASYKANAKVIRAADDLAKETLNILT